MQHLAGRMAKRIVVASCAALFMFSAAKAETITYTYDALGRLTNTQVVGGPANGVQKVFGFDAADNRTLVQVSGGSNSGTITIAPTGAVANATTAGVSLTVNVTGATAPTGMVTFTENGIFIGSAYVIDGQASIFLEGFSLGLHTITVSYGGDSANAAYTYTFTIKVQNLAWLPAVLEIILSD